MAKNFLFLLAAQAIMGISNAFVINVKFALFAKWFEPHNYKRGMSVCVLMGYFGKGLFSILPLAFVDETNPNMNELTVQVGTLYRLLFFMAIALFILIALLYMEDPPEGYGDILSIKTPDRMSTAMLKEELKMMFTDKLFIKYTVCLIAILINIASISDTLNVIGAKYGLSQNQGSLILTGFFGFGILGAIYYDKYLEKDNKIKNYFMIYNVLGILMIIISWICVKWGQYALFAAFFFMCRVLFDEWNAFIICIDIKGIITL